MGKLTRDCYGLGKLAIGGSTSVDGCGGQKIEVASCLDPIRTARAEGTEICRVSVVIQD